MEIAGALGGSCAADADRVHLSVSPGIILWSLGQLMPYALEACVILSKILCQFTLEHAIRLVLSACCLP